MAEFTLTIRNGPRVEREGYDDLEAALGGLERGVERAKSEGGLPTVKMLREFTPSQRVKARLEISTGRLLRRREAGVDVMGDGRVVPFRGSTFKRHLDPEPEVRYRDAVGEALRE
jgi:hypothetical protein